VSDEESEPATPAVLVVEDQAALLDARLSQLARHGVTAIGAERAEQAAAFLAAACRPISLAIIDLNLRPQDPSDRSGLALARLMRAAGLDVPVVGYSAHFEEGAISTEDRREFQAWIEKGRLLPNEISARYAELAQDVAAAQRGVVMERSAAAADALIAFLAETAVGAHTDTTVTDARAYLRASIGARAYDAVDNGSSGHDPLSSPDANIDGGAELPSGVMSSLRVVSPDSE
jgi:CheY-like chemotaxis protein